jgi:hypothetical protein
MSILKKVFGDKRIVALVGKKNSGKTNNLADMILKYRETNKDTPIYIYGLPTEANQYLKRVGGVKEISDIKHLIHKKDCVIIMDEFQRLGLNDRRKLEQLKSFVDFIYHNNCYLILTTPDPREFNTIIGSIIERWLIKTIRIDECVNGSQLKKVVQDYNGRYKSLYSIETPQNMTILINEEQETTLTFRYVKGVDTKKTNKEII